MISSSVGRSFGAARPVSFPALYMIVRASIMIFILTLSFLVAMLQACCSFSDSLHLHSEPESLHLMHVLSVPLDGDCDPRCCDSFLALAAALRFSRTDCAILHAAHAGRRSELGHAKACKSRHRLPARTFLCLGLAGV